MASGMMTDQEHKDLADRLKRIKKRPAQTWITPLIKQMAEFAEDPTRWWIFDGNNNPCPHGYKPEDFVQIQDNIVFRITIELILSPNQPLIVRILQVGSDKYSAAEIPLEITNEAKRAFFGIGVPQVTGMINKLDRTKDFWQYSHVWEDPQALIAEAMGKQGILA